MRGGEFSIVRRVVLLQGGGVYVCLLLLFVGLLAHRNPQPPHTEETWTANQQQQVFQLFLHFFLLGWCVF